MKKKWKKPQLIVLERARPEERVLGGCKTTSENIGASSADTNCQLMDDWGGYCMGACLEDSGS